MLRIFVAAAVLALTGCTSGASQSPVETAATKAWDAAALAELASYLGGQKTTGFLVIQNRQTIIAHNWPLPPDAQAFQRNFVHGQTAQGELREDVASQQKSVIALLVGIAVDKGVLDVDRPVASLIGAGWSKAGAQEAAITVRHLLEMNAGLKEDLTVQAQPGTTFFYNTPAYAVLKRVLEAVSRESLRGLTERWLTKPLGMGDTAWEQRPAAFADVGNPTGLVTTPRDLAKLGQLVLDRGRSPSGERVISEAQLDAIFTPTTTNPAYGRLWWLNTGAYSLNAGPNTPRREGRFIAAAPVDTLSALGAQDRKLFVVPSMKLIVVRTGQAAPDRAFNEMLWTLLMDAAP